MNIIYLGMEPMIIKLMRIKAKGVGNKSKNEDVDVDGFLRT